MAFMTPLVLLRASTLPLGLGSMAIHRARPVLQRPMRVSPFPAGHAILIPGEPFRRR
jgi:hypothetical protein